MELNFFTIGVFTICITVIVNIFFKKINIPIVIGYIVTGIIIVYAFNLKSLSSSGELSEVAEFGIIFLMFVIGLEFSFDKFKTMKQETLLFGILQLITCSFIFYIACYYVMGLDYKTSFVISVSFALSSTAIVLKSFDNQIYSGYQKNSIGILIMQDIAVIPILLIIPALSLSGDTNISKIIITTVISAVIVVAILMIPGKYVASKILGLAANTKMDEIFISTILLIVLGASLVSEYFGFSHSLGAFIAGMVIAGTDYRYKIKADIEHFKDLFLGFFFITVGMQVDILFFLKHIVIILILLICVIVIKTFVIYWTIRVFRNKEESFKTALSLSQIGEFAFVVFLLADKNNIFNGNLSNSIIPIIANYNIDANDLNQYLTLVVILSMIVTPFILERIKAITNFILRDNISIADISDYNDEKPTQEADDFSEYKNHIIVCGYGNFGKSIVSYLKSHNVNYISIDHNYAKVQDGIKDGNVVVFGNIMQTSLIEKLNIKDSAAIIIAIDNSYKIRDVCKILLDNLPNCNIIAKINARAIDNEVEDLNLYAVVDEKKEIARILGQEAIAAIEEKLK
ncbi:hypothetical protein CCY99_06380 [Helicobacter sp. 16-1353]|uniref:cation:proton antiporter domain-containing protein n=1 Tax=Helicobacter sp. 16-1353 TaxID=2004996 RepID=UPI000DCC4046|nr:cation:proton antiporter [Helicobacter sp. 16-1353]RAX52991.1 hypothetical protein CCY99_06380 [Helicobacter sp. 16-1353]